MNIMTNNSAVGIVIGWDNRRIRHYILRNVQDICLTNEFVVITNPKSQLHLFPRWKNDSYNYDHLSESGKSILSVQFMHHTMVISVIGEDGSGSVISLCDFQVSPKSQTSLNLKEVVTEVVCSSGHALIASKTRCFVVGRGSYGQLGLGRDILEISTFQPLSTIPSNEYPISIAVSEYHSCVVTSPYGYVYTFGNGAYYRLGNGSTENNLFYPTLVESLVGVGELNESFIPGGICKVSCSTWHTIVVAKCSNDVYGWGWNRFGQIGTDAGVNLIADHEERMITTPTRIPLFDELEYITSTSIKINDVKCGPRFTAFVLNSNRLFLV